MIAFLLRMFTGNPLSMLYIGGGIFLVAFALGGSAAWTVQGWRLTAVKAEYAKFVIQVKAVGDAREAATKLKDAENKTRKEKSDAENARTKSALTVALNSLRSARPSGGFVPAAPASSARPDLACFDRPDYSGATGRLIERLRGLADECTAATVDLNTAKEWARPN